jgi:hypothetical protein
VKHFERAAFFKDLSAKRLLASIEDALGDEQERKNKDKSKEALAAFCAASIPAGWLPPELRTKAYVQPQAKAAAKPAPAKPAAAKKAKRK